jgi:hypothetical protein
MRSDSRSEGDRTVPSSLMDTLQEENTPPDNHVNPDTHTKAIPLSQILKETP